MKICILGTARSGTTALYCLLQEMLALTTRAPFDYVYEPFMWHTGVFNGRYEAVKSNFRHIRSLSHEGIHHHLSLPMLIRQPRAWTGNPYIREFLQTERPDGNILAKLIRANGRALLLNEICPECRFIFIIRNPLDTVHSILNQFSFFGYEFHRDDFPRFKSEVETVFHTILPVQENSSPCEKEAGYWLYMNRFFLENRDAINDRTCLLCHETFGEEPETAVKGLCKFLDIPYQPAFLETAGRSIGAITRTHELSLSEMDSLLPLLEEYPALLKRHGIRSQISPDQIREKYRLRDMDRERLTELCGLNPVHVKKRLEVEIKKNQALQKKLQQQEQLHRQTAMPAPGKRPAPLKRNRME